MKPTATQPLTLSTSLTPVSQSQTPHRKSPSVSTLNLAKAVQQLSNSTPKQDLDTTNNGSNTVNPNSSKFQFDIQIQKVELQVPSAVYVYVQILKGTSQVNTKKKLRIDQSVKQAVFNEKVSIVTTVEKDQDGKFLTKNISIRLYAFYNSKDKAIGACSVDLSSFLNNKDIRGQSQKIGFQKCFDKNASIYIEVKVKEQFKPITESIGEENSEYSNMQDEGNEMINSSRISTIERIQINSQEDFLLDDNISNIEKKSSSYHEKQFMASPTFTPDGKNGSQTSKTTAYSKSFTLKQDNERPLHSARAVINYTASSRNLTQQFTQSQDKMATPVSSLSLRDDNKFQETPEHLSQSQNLSQVSSFDEQNVKKMDEKIKKLEFEVNYLKKENSEQKQKLVQFQLVSLIILFIHDQQQKEEMTKQFDQKCKELEQFRQKCEVYERKIQDFEEDQKTTEQEKLWIIESYERKLIDLKTQLNESQNQLKTVQSQLTQQQQLQQSYNTSITNSTQADEEQKTPGKEDNSENDANTSRDYKEMYEKLVKENKKQEKYLDDYRKRSDQLEKQLIASKEQIAQLVNELYSIEKEQIDSYM